MKKAPFRKTGFSMIELMVVIGVMILLAGFVVAAMPAIQGKMSRMRAETMLAELESGLESYKHDNGIYPQNPPTGGRNSAGLDGAAVLYKHLSGDWNEDGDVDSIDDGDEQDEKVYVDKLAFNLSSGSKNRRSTVLGSQYVVIDPFGNPFRYLAIPPNEENNLMKNTTYDLWSIGDSPSGGGNEANFITNWGN